MGAFRTDPAPFLPRHIWIVECFAIARQMQAFGFQLLHRGGNIICAEA